MSPRKVMLFLILLGWMVQSPVAAADERFYQCQCGISYWSLSSYATFRPTGCFWKRVTPTSNQVPTVGFCDVETTLGRWCTTASDADGNALGTCWEGLRYQGIHVGRIIRTR